MKGKRIMTTEEAWEIYYSCQDGEDAAACGMADEYQQALDVLENDNWFQDKVYKQ